MTSAIQMGYSNPVELDMKPDNTGGAAGLWQQQQQQQQQPQRRKAAAARQRHLARGKPVFGAQAGKAVLVAGKEVITHPGDPGFTTVQLPTRDRVSYLAVLWSEFLGTLLYATAARLFVGFFGGTTFAATIPTLYGTALSNSLAFMAAMVVFGGVSGGHFNPAITLCILPWACPL
jgi:hypothetical protein